MAESNLTLKDIAIRLFKANAIKFGSFTTQSGAVTPVYFDLRVTVSYPSLMVSTRFLIVRVHEGKLYALNLRVGSRSTRLGTC